MTGYSLRPSQFVFAFGIGSIIETSNGPRIIPDFDNWGQIFGKYHNRLNVSDFQIDVSLNRNILDGNIFSIPTNVLLDKKENEGIYNTIAFPDWGLCVEHGYLYEFDGDRTRCPLCKAKKIFTNQRKQAIRFVRACPAGHLDDVDWRGMIDHTASCSSRIYRWNNEGGSLDNLKIVCSSCNHKTTLQDVYNKNKKCTGRFPEKPKHYVDCSEESRITLRGSSMLRIPKLLPLVAIPGPVSKCHKALSKNTLLTILNSDDDWTQAKLIKRITMLNKNSPGSILDDDLHIIETVNEKTLKTAIIDVQENNRNSPSTLLEKRYYEFKTLQNAARNGHPLNPDTDPYFSVPKRRIRSDGNDKDSIKLKTKKLRVSPIEKLKVITVQKGYQRLGTEDLDIKGIKHPVIEKFHLHEDERWYPGIEQIGEGIFIDDHDEDLNISSQEWNERFRALGHIEYHPVFVWWHSLAHRLISAISLHSGYSSASIREIVYINKESENVKGGILLYTSQPGGDGSLGGMSSKVSTFERIVEQAISDLEFCSNDPLCYEQNVKKIGDSGAACYACLHMSETSCSYFNRFLDRKILLENL